MGLNTWLRTVFVSDEAVRGEIWRLGARHHGWPLEGAEAELIAADVTPARAQLLRACIRKLRSA